FLDAEELVVFCDAIGARRGAGLDLAGAHGDDEIRDERVFGFAGAVRNHRRVIRFARYFDGFDRFGDGADLVELDENRVADAFGDAAREDFGIRDEDVVADQLYAALRG